MTDDSLDGPLDHVIRVEPPWRAERLTECGRPAADVTSVVTREELVAKIARLGKKRASFSTCMTCAERTHGTVWERDCVAIMRRDTAYGPRGHSDAVKIDLLALTALWRAHPEEFEMIRASLTDGDDVSRARQRRSARPTRLRSL